MARIKEKASDELCTKCLDVDFGIKHCAFTKLNQLGGVTLKTRIPATRLEFLGKYGLRKAKIVFPW